MTSDYGAFFGRAQCYVDGAWSTPSGDPATVVIDPFPEQPIGEVAEAGGPLVKVYSADRDHAERFAHRLDCGQVKISGVRTRDHPDVPFGGTKLSGYGRELGALGLAEMTEVTAVMS